MKITKEEYIKFKKQHKLKNQKIAEICCVSKSTANGWSQLKSNKSIPKLAMRVLYSHVVYGIKLRDENK